MRIAATIISYLLHPSLIVSYALLLFLLANPYIFGVDRFYLQSPFFISVAFMTFMLPAINVFIMKKIGLVSSISLENAKQRVGPYIAVIVFYLWLYLTIRTNYEIPALFKCLVLGSTITAGTLFFVNNFSKVSSHMAGMSGLVIFSILLIQPQYGGETHLGFIGAWFETHPALLPAVLVFATSLVALSRLELKMHTRQEIIGGLLIGILSQIIALIIYY